jgi:hypothetical protein
MKKDFSFLFDQVARSQGDLWIGLRDGYFNVYYRGNSLAKVAFKPNDIYLVTINKRFAAGVFDGDDRFTPEIRDRTLEFKTHKKDLHPLLQVKYVDKLCANIKAIGYSEELQLEQMIITDNLGRKDLFFIDRQVADDKSPA